MTDYDTSLTSAITRLSEITRAAGMDVMADDIREALDQIDDDLDHDPMQWTLRIGLAAGAFAIASILGTTFLVEQSWHDPISFLGALGAVIPTDAG